MLQIEDLDAHLTFDSLRRAERVGAAHVPTVANPPPSSRSEEIEFLRALRSAKSERISKKRHSRFFGTRPSITGSCAKSLFGQQKMESEK